MSFGLPSFNDLISSATNTPSFRTQVLQSAPNLMSRLNPVASALGAGSLWNVANKAVGLAGNISASQDNIGSLMGASNIRRVIRNADGTSTVYNPDGSVVVRPFKKGGKVKKIKKSKL
jgi:hypothetical protein